MTICATPISEIHFRVASWLHSEGGHRCNDANDSHDTLVETCGLDAAFAKSYLVKYISMGRERWDSHNLRTSTVIAETVIAGSERERRTRTNNETSRMTIPARSGEPARLHQHSNLRLRP